MAALGDVFGSNKQRGLVRSADGKDLQKRLGTRRSKLPTIAHIQSTES
jgi:hypothetical protein